MRFCLLSGKWKTVIVHSNLCVLIILGLISFDSVQDGSVATFTPHTAFEDPSAPADAALRESIELRAFVFYD